MPYLGVEQKFSETDAAGQTFIMDDLRGFSPSDAEKYLKSQTLSAMMVGSGEIVTAQIPAPGEAVPGGSQVLLYLGEAPEEREAEVPDFLGMNRQQASDAAGTLGLYVLVTGNGDISPYVTVTAQNIAPGTKVPVGTTITLEFTDTSARD